MSVDAASIREDILEYLQKWFDKVHAKKVRQGKTLNLTFQEWLDLWGKRRINSLTQWQDQGYLYAKMRRSTKDDPNDNGYVFSPISFAASRSLVQDKSNMQICTRGQAKLDCRMKKGDKHTDDSIAKISNKKKGVTRNPDSNRKTSETMKGMKRRPMTPAEKEKKREKALAYHARRRAEKEAAANGGAASL